MESYWISYVSIFIVIILQLNSNECIVGVPRNKFSLRFSRSKIINNLCSFFLFQYGSDEFGQDSPRYTSPKAAALYADPYYIGKLSNIFYLRRIF